MALHPNRQLCLERTDITVNVTVRFRPPFAQLPPEVRALGLCSKQSSSILQFISVYSPAQKHDTLFMTNATINVLDDCPEPQASARRNCSVA